MTLVSFNIRSRSPRSYHFLKAITMMYLCQLIQKKCQIWPLVEDIKSKFFYGCMTLIMTLVTLKIGKDHLTEIRSTAPANV